MSMRGAVAGCVVLVCLVAQLAERTEGHITFFSPKEMMEMKGREGRKDRSENSLTTESPGRAPTTQPSPKLPDDIESEINLYSELEAKHQRAK